MPHLPTLAVLSTLRRERWRRFREMSDIQWLDESALRELHDRKLAALLRHAVRHVPRYRDLGAARLDEFPLVDKLVMTAEQASFLSDEAGPEDRLASSTGGSSGILFKFYTDARSREIRRACDMLGRTWAGWEIGDRQALLWGHRGDVSATETARNRLANELLHRSITLNAFTMDEATVDGFIRRLQSYRPRLLVGYASALTFLAATMSRRGIAGVHPRGIISSAESLSDEQRGIIEAQFGCRVSNRYGSREFAPVAQQCEEAAGFHVFADRVHVEVLRADGSPCTPGERGEITVTDLDNFAMPFIRYRTGDLAIATDERCRCGRGLPLIARVEGRVSELIVGLNGQVYACPGPTFWTAGVTGIHQLQIYQGSRERVELRVVPGPQWSEESARGLTARFRELLGDVQVEIVMRDEIPVAASGKYRFAISEVSPFSRPNG
ncbi:MAG: hypothetical protein Q7W29_08495 [bacterium]|nr:hypothetical protein [bacterium]